MDHGKCYYTGCVIWLIICLCQSGAMQRPPGNPLGMESGAIPDSSLTASSQWWDQNHGPERARLNIQRENGLRGAWATLDNTTNGNHWIQIDLLTTYSITGVATQGRPDYGNQWITSFKIACSMDGIAFENVKDALSQPSIDKIFTGNSDRNSIVYNNISTPMDCRYVRLLPIAFHEWISLRMELYGVAPDPGFNISLLYAQAPGEGFVLKDDGSSKGLLCAYSSWNIKSAEVACRMLGFHGVESFTKRFVPFFSFDPNSVPVLRDGYNCTGNEATLGQCTPVRHKSSCNNQAAGVICTNNIVRLSGSDVRHQGRVEVYNEAEYAGWGSVCSSLWDNKDAVVVCRMLGYPNVEGSSESSGGPANPSFTVSGLGCNGNEQSIDECAYFRTSNVPCSSNMVVELRCQNAAQLVDGPCASEGRVEVYQNGSWGAVCDDNFTTEDATIVCQMLESRGLELVDVLPPTTVSMNAALRNPLCSGDETDIRYCMYDKNSECNSYAAVKCSDPLNSCPISNVDCDTDYSSFVSLACDPTTTVKTTSTTQSPSTLTLGTTAKMTTQGMTTSTATVPQSPSTVAQMTTRAKTTMDSTTVITSTHNIVTTQSPLKGAINEILNENVTVDNVDSVSDELANVTENSSQFDEDDLQSVTDTLSTIVRFASIQNLTEETVVKVSENVVGAVDNILNIPEATFQTTNSKEVSRDILNTISTLTEAIQNTSTNNFTYSGSNIVLAAVKVDRRKFPLTTAIGRTSDNDFDFSANEKAPSEKEGVTSVSLPEAVLPSVPNSNQVVSVSVFLVTSPKLFQEDQGSSSSTPSSERKKNGQIEQRSVVASPILSVTVEGADIKDLPENESIVFSFPVNQSLAQDEPDIEVTSRCVYWDIDIGKWSDYGCRTEKGELEGLVTCRCNHLTSFAVLLDIKGSIISKTLDVISRIGCIASIICLILTLCILLGFRKLRVKQPQQILINLSFALLALYVTFIFGIDRPTWGVGCSVVAVLLHYFCLASLAWMGVEAFSMYMMFVRVMNSYIPSLILKCSLVSWGIPLVVVIVTAASNWTAYQNYNYCFVLPGYSLYFGLLLPIGLILAFNSIIFFMVIYRLTCGRQTFSKGSPWESKKESTAKARMEAIRRAQNAVAIGTLLGLTWCFGFLAFGGGRFLFNVLFTIFNSLQGVFVFLLFGIRQPEVRDKLRAASIRLMHGASYARRRSSDMWASSSGARMTPRPSDVTFVSMGKNSSIAETQHSMCSESTRNEEMPLNKESHDTIL